MKRKLMGLFVVWALLMPVLCMAAAAPGTVTQNERKNYPEYGIRQIVFTCIGSADDGSIPNTATDTTNTNFISGWVLYQVDAYPTAGGTAPDAASVFILDANDLDLLGSEDGSTTPYNGLNLIHATLPRSALPNKYIPGDGTHVNFYPVVTGALTLKVISQATVSANYTVVLTFIKAN